MKRLRVLFLALLTASVLAMGTGSAFANPNGAKQNGVCQNGYFDPVLGHCVNNQPH